MKVMLLIRSLNVGGTERQLVELAKALHQRGQGVSVVTFYEGGALAGELDRAGVRRLALDKRGRWDVAPFIIRLWRLVRRERPDLLYSYLGSANTLSASLVKALPGVNLVWGVRSSNVDLSRYDWFVRLVFLMEGTLSRIPRLIIANSEAGKRHCVANGFPSNKLVVIPNGIDTNRFYPDPAARATVRSEWQIKDQEKLIGLVARFDPLKDHASFFKAAALLGEQRRDVRFACIGDGEARYRESLQQMASDLGLGDQVIWAGARTDMNAVFNSLDIACSCSYSEGFPNVVAEAMACGVPCVVTDAGDSALIVGDTGIVVPTRSVEGLASGWSAMLDRLAAAPGRDGRQARERIVRHFGSEQMVLATESALTGLVR